MLPYLKGALQRDMPVLVEALAADFKEKAEETQLKKLDALEAQISRDFDAFDALSTDLATPEKMSGLNQDSNYKQSICEVIDFKHVRMSKLVREQSALGKDYLQDSLTTGLHVAAREGRTKTAAALAAVPQWPSRGGGAAPAARRRVKGHAVGLAVMGGRTPMYWARDGGHREMEALLRQHGAECPYAFDDSD